MTRRFRIFEPRYRALVKQCIAEDRPLVILPLSRGGNMVATAARVTGLHNVEEDGRYGVRPAPWLLVFILLDGFWGVFGARVEEAERFTRFGRVCVTAVGGTVGGVWT